METGGMRFGMKYLYSYYSGCVNWGGRRVESVAVIYCIPSSHKVENVPTCGIWRDKHAVCSNLRYSGDG